MVRDHVLRQRRAVTQAQDAGVVVEVTGDQHTQDREGKAKGLYRVFKTLGGVHANLAGELQFADMRQTIGLQAADLLAYEMTKELNNQDLRPEDQMRWPLGQILGDAANPYGKMLKYNNAASLMAQAAQLSDEERHEVTRQTLDDSLRILRGKAGPFKERFERSRKGSSRGCALA